MVVSNRKWCLFIMNFSRAISIRVLISAPWGRGQSWSSKRWFFYRTDTWPGWKPKSPCKQQILHDIYSHSSSPIPHKGFQSVCVVCVGGPRWNHLISYRSICLLLIQWKISMYIVITSQQFAKFLRLWNSLEMILLEWPLIIHWWWLKDILSRYFLMSHYIYIILESEVLQI